MGMGASVAVDEDLAPICSKLNLTTAEASKLHSKFQEIDTDGSGVIDIDEFFQHLGIEKTPFGAQLFTLIDENGSGEIDFNEFLVGLWNMCTFDEDALLKFAFQLIDRDNSGYVDQNEVCDMVKAVHGKKFDKKLIPHVKKVMAKYDKNGDNQFSFDEFKGCHKELPLLFMPAFTLKNLMEDDFFGEAFWRNAKKARKKDARAQSIRDFMALNKECQRVAPAKYGGGGGAPQPPQKKKNKIWEARELDDRKMRVEDFDPAKKKKTTRADKLEDRYAKEDRTGFRRFDLDRSEAKRDYKKDPVIREDRKRYEAQDLFKGSKSKQFRDNQSMKNGGSEAYHGPRRAKRR